MYILSFSVVCRGTVVLRNTFVVCLGEFDLLDSYLPNCTMYGQSMGFVVFERTSTVTNAVHVCQGLKMLKGAVA